MDKKKIFTFAALSLGLLVLLISATRPSVDNAWLLIAFFITYYSSIFFGILALGVFLKFSVERMRRIALVAASVITAVQVLVTFQALRPVELALIVSVLILTGWYVSRAKS